ncbi:hypothetical protein Tco_0196758 [Tanacetum coccineum]
MVNAMFVVAAPVISISSNVSVESVGSSFPRVILIGCIFVEVPVVPEVGAAAVPSPVGVLELDTHSSSEADSSESSPPPVSIAPMVSPFLCSDDSESDTEIPERHVSPTSSTLEIPTAPILPAPSVIVAPSSKFPLAPIGQSLSGHTPPDTTDADSSTPQRFVHPSLVRTPWCSKSYLRWRFAPLSTMYPPMTSESSAGDSSSESSTGPSRKRCRDSISPEDSVEEDIDMDVLEDIEADATAVEVSVDRDVEVRVDAGINMEADVGDDVKDKVEDEVESSERGTMEVGVDVAVGIDIPDAMLMPDAVERLEQAEEGLQDIYDHVLEIPL